MHRKMYTILRCNEKEKVGFHPDGERTVRIELDAAWREKVGHRVLSY